MTKPTEEKIEEKWLPINLGKINNMGKKYAKDFVKYPNSKIVKEWIEDGIKIVILACRGSHFTAYFGIPKDHPLAGFDYDDIPLKIHGGLTYGREGSKIFPTGYFFYGWDYAHLGDRVFIEGLGFNSDEDEHEWTLEEVETEAKDALYDFKKLVRLAEMIKNK